MGPKGRSSQRQGSKQDNCMRQLCSWRLRRLEYPHPLVELYKAENCLVAAMALPVALPLNWTLVTIALPKGSMLRQPMCFPVIGLRGKKQRLELFGRFWALGANGPQRCLED